MKSLGASAINPGAYEGLYAAGSSEREACGSPEELGPPADGPEVFSPEDDELAKGASPALPDAGAGAPC